MKNTSTIQLYDYHECVVPKWFFNWFMMLEHYKNEIHREIEQILSEWDFLWAKDYYYRKTIYNEEKTWH